MHRLSRFCCILFVISIWILLVRSEQGIAIIPAQLYLELAYHNPHDYSSSGWCDIWPHDSKCDVYFIICIGNAWQFSPATCDIARKKTATYSESNKLQLEGLDLIQLPISNSVPNSIKLRIDVWDQDQMSSDDHIATFTSNVIILNASSTFKKIELSKIGETYHNAAVNLGLWLKMECSTDYYGPLCKQYCKTDYHSYHCNKDGLRICYPGYRGIYCEKRDNCYYEPCATNAQCSNTDDEIGRICYCNGGSGPECYKVSDICNPSPCENGGICMKTGPFLQQFICECTKHYFGTTCGELISSCEITLNALSVVSSNGNKTEVEVCLNGGTCVDLTGEFGHYCQCASGWKGLNCEIPDWTAAIVVPLIVLLLLILIGLSVFLYYRICRRKKSLPTIQVMHADSARTWYTAKPVSACENETYIGLPNNSTSPQQKYKNALPPQTTVQEDQVDENEYDHLVDPPSYVMDETKESYSSIRYASLKWSSPEGQIQPPPNLPPSYPRLPASIKETDTSRWSNADVYEIPIRNSFDYNSPDGNGEPMGLFGSNHKIPDDPNLGYEYLSDDIKPSFNQEERDTSQPDYLPQLPVKVSTVQQKHKR